MYGKSYKTIQESVSVATAIDLGFSELSSLGEEFREWADNMSEGLQATEKYSRVDEAASALENHTELNAEIPETFGATMVSVSIGVKRLKKEGPSRAARLGNACSYLRAAEEACTARIGEIEERLQEINDKVTEAAELNEAGERVNQTDAPDITAEESTEETNLTEEKDHLDELVAELAEVADEAEGLDLPTMYG